MSKVTEVTIKVRALLLERSYLSSLLLGGLILAIGLSKYGLTMWSGWRILQQAAVNWQAPKLGSLAQPPQDGVLANSGVSRLAGIMGITSTPSYVTLMVILAFLAVSIPFLMPKVLASVNLQKVIFVVLAGGPVLSLTFMTIGSYDVLIVIAAAVAVLARSRWISALGWAVLAFQHTTIGALALLVWGVFEYSRFTDFKKWRQLIWLPVLGLTIGIMANTLMVASIGGVTSRLELFRMYPFSFYVHSMVAGMPMILFGVLGIVWIVALDSRVRRLRETKVLLIAGLACAFLLPLIAQDQSRIPILVLYPTVLAWCMSLTHGNDGEILAKRIWNRYAIAAAIVPVVMVYWGIFIQTGWSSLLSFRGTLQ
jgi:hypothetical protein